MKKIQITKTGKRFYQKNEITICLELQIYEGFDSLQELEIYVAKKGLDLKYMATVKFLDMYYGVFIENFDKEIIIGKANVWFRDKGFMKSVDSKKFKRPYSINKLRIKPFESKGISRDLKQLDTEINVFRYKSNKLQDITEYMYSDMYLILLGLTFYNTFFTQDESEIFLREYFMMDFYWYFKEENKIKRINPFHSLVELTNGKIMPYSFF